MELNLTEHFPIEVKKELAAYALENSDIETCGFLLKDGTFKPAENIADTFTSHELKEMGLDFIGDSDARSHVFVMDSEAQSFFRDNPDKIAAVFHSHCRDDKPGYLSDPDIRNSRASKIPYLLYHCHPDIDDWDLFDPKALHPYPLKDRRKFPITDVEYYLGWPYNHPRCDCLTLFRSYYKGVLGIHVNDYPRPKSVRDYIKGVWNAYDENLGNEGFVKIESSLKKHDLILMRLIGTIPHHIAIMLDPDKGIALDLDPAKGSSKTFVYGGTEHINQTHSIWRHTSLINA
ncbi:MAG: hypothetical protein KME47_09325 [Nodosilinea sp. WJT8-NPBG4]|jgi:proteasome lid subunit RPN8/RPN11|nr:hypothetical protein [Nodosilinea sp. WJT8-NPBG4]